MTFHFLFPGVLETLDMSYTSKTGGGESEFPSAAAVRDDLEKSMFYGKELSNLSLASAECNSVTTLKRTLDINFLENKIKQLTTNVP